MERALTLLMSTTMQSIRLTTRSSMFSTRWRPVKAG